MLEIRRLEVETDGELFREAYGWDESAPRWYTESDAIFRPTYEDFITPDDSQSFIGVFNGSFIALLALTQRAKGIYELHLWAKRGSDAGMIAEAAFHVKESLFKDLGAQKLFAMVARKNYSVKRMCKAVGLEETGVILITGTYHGRCIEWLMHEAVNEQKQN